MASSWGCGGSPARDADFFVELEPSPSFVHQTGATGQFYFPEVMGAGGALFDFDGDGDLDLYAAQGKGLQGTRLPVAEADGSALESASGRLFRNDLTSGQPSFVDVTVSAGLQARGYGMGAAVGDVDNDGWPDLYLTNFGANELWRNRGDGTFEERTAEAGVGDAAWSVSATFVDLDDDGWLDLYVANYVDFEVEKNVQCHGALGIEDYCSPLVYQPAADSLYRNRGDGTFEDISLRSGIRRSPQNGLGVLALDADGDGRLDLYVANDMTPNHLWMNQGDGTFLDQALVAGVAVNASGQAEASMGVVAGDIDRDGDEDLLVTHLRSETHTLYLQERPGLYRDVTGSFGLGRPTIASTGFGVALVDLELDGWLDLMIANGAVTAIEALARAGDPRPLHEPDQLFRNRAGTGFEETSSRGGSHFMRSEIGRGLAAGDLDQDGDVDLVEFNNGGPLRILMAQTSGRWLGVEVLDDRYRRPALGILVEVELDDGSVLIARVARDGSYAVAKDPRRLFGLGEAEVRRVVARWPDGFSVERRSDVDQHLEGRYLVLRRPADEDRPADEETIEPGMGEKL